MRDAQGGSIRSARRLALDRFGATVVDLGPVIVEFGAGALVFLDPILKSGWPMSSAPSRGLFPVALKNAKKLALSPAEREMN